jgi:hypothetical protein
MAANGSVIDELVVKLTLDADEYEKKEKNITVIINKTEKQLTAVDKKRKERDNQQNKRWKESTKAVKEFGNSLGKLALTVGSVLGVGGGVGGLIAAVTALAGFETNLRKTGVSTGLSNRELQAYGSTIKRLGGDAEAGTQAIAALAKEQKQFALTGNAPTLQAFQRIGVNAGPNSNIVDVLAEAQQRYRAAPEGQRSQMENVLSASGVSPDLIVAIKSETDVRDAYNRSLAESTTENRKALDAVSDAMESTKNAALDLANSIASIAQPYVKEFGDWVHKSATKLSDFADRVAEAGGGVDGFFKVLDKENPELAATLHGLNTGLRVFGEAVEVIVFGFKQLGAGIGAIGDWINKLTGSNVTGSISGAIGKAWAELVGDARRESGGGGVKLSPQAAARINGTAAPTPAPAGGATPATREGIVQGLIARGYSAAQAYAAAANIHAESGFDPSAFNPAGGGQGAQGLLQWRGARVNAFRARFGKDPRSASVDEQLDFLTQDPYERHLTNLAFRNGGTAEELGTNFSRIVEAHGNVKRDIERGQLARQYAAAGGAPAAAGPTVNINGPVSVQASNPSEFVNGVQRVSGITNYNTATR